jgi:hypothetical protein
MFLVLRSTNWRRMHKKINRHQRARLTTWPTGTREACYKGRRGSGECEIFTNLHQSPPISSHTLFARDHTQASSIMLVPIQACLVPTSHTWAWDDRCAYIAQDEHLLSLAPLRDNNMLRYGPHALYYTPFCPRPTPSLGRRQAAKICVRGVPQTIACIIVPLVRTPCHVARWRRAVSIDMLVSRPPPSSPASPLASSCLQPTFELGKTR